MSRVMRCCSDPIDNNCPTLSLLKRNQEYKHSNMIKFKHSYRL